MKYYRDQFVGLTFIWRKNKEGFWSMYNKVDKVWEEYISKPSKPLNPVRVSKEEAFIEIL